MLRSDAELVFLWGRRPFFRGGDGEILLDKDRLVLCDGLRPRITRIARFGGEAERESARAGRFRYGGGDLEKDSERDGERRREGRYVSLLVVVWFGGGEGDRE